MRCGRFSESSRGYPRESREMLFDAHNRAFIARFTEYIGLFEVPIYDFQYENTEFHIRP